MRKHANMGKKRKAIERKRSTPSAEELFAELGEPGKRLARLARRAERRSSSCARSAQPGHERVGPIHWRT